MHVELHCGFAFIAVVISARSERMYLLKVIGYCCKMSNAIVYLSMSKRSRQVDFVLRNATIKERSAIKIRIYENFNSVTKGMASVLDVSVPWCVLPVR